MSRRLFTSSTATANRPITAPVHQAARRGGSAMGEARRPEPLVRVHAAHPVEVVVREVHTDLEPGGDGDRSAEPPPDDVSGCGGPDEHGNEPDAEGPGPRPEPPD